MFTFPAVPHWMVSVNTSPSHPACGGTCSSAVGAAQHSLGFLPREQRGNPAWWKITTSAALWTPPALSPSTRLLSSCEKTPGVLRGYVLCCGFLPVQWGFKKKIKALKFLLEPSPATQTFISISQMPKHCISHHNSLAPTEEILYHPLMLSSQMPKPSVAWAAQKFRDETKVCQNIQVHWNENYFIQSLQADKH